MGLKNKIEDVVFLLVEDNKLPLVIMSRGLKELGITDILKVNSGQSAFQILLTEPVDLVISDWNMPVMDGLDFYRSIIGGVFFNLKVFIVKFRTFLCFW
jgi:CheY-like chemotaxis protein